VALVGFEEAMVQIYLRHDDNGEYLSASALSAVMTGNRKRIQDCGLTTSYATAVTPSVLQKSAVTPSTL